MRLSNAIPGNEPRTPRSSPFKLRNALGGLALNLAAAAVWAAGAAAWAVLHHHRGVLGYALPWGIAVFLAGLLVLAGVSYLRLRRRVAGGVGPPGGSTDAALGAAAGEQDEQPQIPGVPVVDLLAREGELAAISEFTRNNTAGFLTLKGPGGIGKSALAGAALRAARKHGLKVAFIELDKTERVDDFIVRVAKGL
jgi:hypothetical protein